MKNKTKTYLLLVTVLVIWGVIGLKIVNTLNPDAPKIVQQDDMFFFSPKTNKANDTFSIQLSERDPFLGTLNIKKKPEVNQKNTTKKETIAWIPIIYHGSVSKQDSKQKIFVLSINTQQHIMKVGQDRDGVKLLKANDQAITISYKGLKKIIEKV